jgi:hypothetical protein
MAAGSTGPVRANIHMMALPKSALSAVPHPGVPCIITKKVREFGPRMVDVGGLYSFVTDAAMKMTYMAGASTTMGVAISIPFPGEVGSFSAEGTFTETASGKEAFPVEHDQADVNMQTPYTYGEYSICGLMNQVQPEVWVTGDREVKVNPPVTDPPDKCSHHYSPGTGLTRNTGTAGTFKAGVNLTKEIGINLSAQSGYTKNVSIKWMFTSNGPGGYICGTNGYPSSAAFNVMDQTQFGNPAP